jgi:hypothetical protein
MSCGNRLLRAILNARLPNISRNLCNGYLLFPVGLRQVVRSPPRRQIRKTLDNFIRPVVKLRYGLIELRWQNYYCYSRGLCNAVSIRKRNSVSISKAASVKYPLVQHWRRWSERGTAPFILPPRLKTLRAIS